MGLTCCIRSGRGTAYIFHGLCAEDEVDQALKAQAATGGSNEIFYFSGGLEMPFPTFSREQFHKSKHGKTFLKLINNSSSSNKGNHDGDRVWISDLNKHIRILRFYFSVFSLV